MTFALPKRIKIMTLQKYLSILCLAAIQIYFGVLVTWLTPTQLQRMCQILSQLQRAENKTPESNFRLYQKGTAASETNQTTIQIGGWRRIERHLQTSCRKTNIETFMVFVDHLEKWDPNTSSERRRLVRNIPAFTQKKVYFPAKQNYSAGYFSITSWSEINPKEVGERLHWNHRWECNYEGRQCRYLLRRLNIRPDSKQKPNWAINDTT